MKKTKNIAQTFAVIALVLFFVQVIFSGVGVSFTDAMKEEYMSSGLFMVIAVCFIFAGNKVVEKVGYGLLGVLVSISLAQLIGSQQIVLNTIPSIISLALIAVLSISVISFFVGAVLRYYGYSKGDGYREGALSKLSILKKWNKLVENVTISADDYLDIKEIVLSPESNATLVKLEEYRELLECGLISVGDLHTYVKKPKK
ncbi:MAG: hypothetical protein RBQ97_06895 [Acholeplasma sp.]|nr:hypothetical protein [Acholeplasma sp.]